MLTEDQTRADKPAQAIAELLERIEHAHRSGLDVFGMGEHHRKEFLDSAPHMILALLHPHKTHSTYQRSSRTERNRSGAGISKLCNARPNIPW